MLRSVVIAALISLAVLPATAEEQPAGPQQIELKGVPAVVTPPAMPGTERATAPGQWQITYQGEGGFHRLQVRVFPVRDLREPGPVLMQVLDTLVRNSGFGAFGATGRRTLEVWGRPAADAAIELSIQGKVARGRARLLLATDTHWAFAWGAVTAPELSRGTLAAIEAFTKSLEPRDPTFYAPRFREDALLATVVYRAAGEAPITNAHLYAIASLIEAGLGRRFPLDTRRNVETMLLLDVREGSEQTRKGYREAGLDVANSMRLEPKARAERMQALGTRIVEAIEARAKTGYRPAIGALRLWTLDGRAVVGEGDGALQSGMLKAEVEVAEFLVAIARDRPAPAPAEVHDRHAKVTREAWVELSPERRGARASIRDAWARLRHAWDAAEPAGRRAFRRAVVKALLPPDTADEPPAPEDLRGLKRWMVAHADAFEGAQTFQRALALAPAALAALIDRLGVEASGYQFGW